MMAFSSATVPPSTALMTTSGLLPEPFLITNCASPDAAAIVPCCHGCAAMEAVMQLLSESLLDCHATQALLWFLALVTMAPCLEAR
jgi:hypothetical protein